MRNEVTADWNTLAIDAEEITDRFFRSACSAVERDWGDGAAKKNPALVATLVSAMATEYASISHTVGLQNIANAITDAARSGGNDA